jgi:hypothetical protein
MLLSAQDGRLMSASPEGEVFDAMRGRYSSGHERQFVAYLKGHAGDELKVHRVSRPPVVIERPALTCAFAVQPCVIESMARDPEFRGRGLLARFLYAAPRSWIGERKVGPPPVPERAQLRFQEKIRRLAAIEGQHRLGLTPQASRIFRAWQIEIEAMLAEGGQLESIRDWGGKLAGATLRIAGILHTVDYGDAGPIEDFTIVKAVEVARYLIPHAQYVLQLMAASKTKERAEGQIVLRWIKRTSKSEFTRSQAQQSLRGRFPQADDIDPALGELTRRGYIRRRHITPTGRPGQHPSPLYEVNPIIKSKCCPENTENTENVPA